MARTILVSTGTMVGRLNGFNYKRALGVIRELADDGLCEGLELMMLPAYYDVASEVVGSVRSSGVRPVVIHCEKEIGTILSNAGALNAEGRTQEADETAAGALDLFRLNCEIAESLEIPRMVIHLWGGAVSDRHIEYNGSCLPILGQIASVHGIRLLVENVPSNTNDPLSNWRAILPLLGHSGLIFDTRFGKLHEQTKEIFSDPAVCRHIEHVHISDFAGTYRDFKALRPILHPGEGSVDFNEVAALLDGIRYDGTITLESPVMEEDRLKVPKLRDSLTYIRDLMIPAGN